MALLACALASPCAGCGESNGLYPVYGKVNVNGEPASGATVYFHRTGPAILAVVLCPVSTPC